MFLIDEIRGEGALAERATLTDAGVLADMADQDRKQVARRILADSRISTPVVYTLQTWQQVGGARQLRGSAEGAAGDLQALVFSAEVLLVTSDHQLIDVELTDVENGVAHFREPRRF